MYRSFRFLGWANKISCGFYLSRYAVVVYICHLRPVVRTTTTSHVILTSLSTLSRHPWVLNSWMSLTNDLSGFYFCSNVFRGARMFLVSLQGPKVMLHFAMICSLLLSIKCGDNVNLFIHMGGVFHWNFIDRIFFACISLRNSVPWVAFQLLARFWTDPLLPLVSLRLLSAGFVAFLPPNHFVVLFTLLTVSFALLSSSPSICSTTP